MRRWQISIVSPEFCVVSPEFLVSPEFIGIRRQVDVGLEGQAGVIRVRLVAREDERDHGTWRFPALPLEGHIVAIRINDQPALFRVTSVIHAPVLFTPNPGEESDEPYVTIGIETFTPSLA